MSYTRFDVEETLKALSDSEKIALLSGSDFWHTTAIKRHNIPRVRVSDGPNGIRGIRFFAGISSNCFPSETGMASTWDVHFVYKMGQQLAKECRQKGAHVWLGPTLNIQRSPLGGRGFESWSEDALLSGKLSAAAIRGCQDAGVAATPKHYVANDQETDRASNSSDLTDRALREIYLKPFQIAIREGKPWALMTAYNRVNGIHVSENPYLLQDILRNEWGWKEGVAMSDWYGTYSTTAALKAGLDLEMPGSAIWRGQAMNRALQAGKVKTSDLDKSARRILNLVNRAIDSQIPFEKEEETGDTKETRELLADAAAQAIVLLKNTSDILPLSKDKVKRVALIGPNAKVACISGGGSASLNPSFTISPKEAIEEASKKHGIEIAFSEGVRSARYLPLTDNLVSWEGKKRLYHLSFYAENPESNSSAKAIHTMTADTSMALLADGIPDTLPFRLYLVVETDFTPDEDGDWEFGLGVAGKARLYLNDELVVANDENQTMGELFFSTGTIEEKGQISLTKGQKYRLVVKWNNMSPAVEGADLLGRGAYRIGAQTVLDAKQAVVDAVETAKSCDAVVLVVGLNSDYEAESFDRPHMQLPPGVDDLVSKIIVANPNTVVVNQSGTQCEMPWFGSAKAVLQAFYGGNSCGTGMARVLFGEHNPSSKCPLSFTHKLEHFPSHPQFPGKNGRSFYNEDVFCAYRGINPKNVVASFGFGLSYTTFEISDLKVNEAEVDAAARSVSVSLEVTVKNTGKQDGGEVVQVYIHPSKSDLARPEYELAAFGKVFLKAGESKTVKLELDRGAFSYWDSSKECDGREGCWVIHRAMYTLAVGNSLDNLPLTEQIPIKDEIHWLGL